MHSLGVWQFLKPCAQPGSPWHCPHSANVKPETEIEGWSQGFVVNFWRPYNTERCTHLKHKTVNTYVLIQIRVASARKHPHTFTSHHGVMSVEADFTHLCHICMGSQDIHF